MKRIYAVLALSICVLLSLSSCSVWNNSPLEDLSTVTIPRIDDAITHAKAFPSEIDELVDNIGCIIWKLIEKMREFDPKEVAE